MLELHATFDVSAEPLPEFWPDQPPPEPAQAWWIPWPLAVVLVPLLWIMPRRMGPHFAAVRWPGVIVGHLFWTIYGLSSVDLAYWAQHYGWVAWLTKQAPGQASPALWPPPSAWDIFRAPLALEAVWLGETITNIEHYLLAWGVFVGCELGVAAIGLLLIPYATSGEKWGRLAARCIKLTLWATTSAIVLGLALQAVALWSTHPSSFQRMMQTMGVASPDAAQASALHSAIAIVCALYLGWFMWIWLRSGARYWGPKEGSGWQQQRPACEKCGYTLTGLTAADHCPECGRAVTDSLPARRRPTCFEQARGLRRIPAFFRTARGAMSDRSFAAQVTMRGSYPSARRFALWMCVLAAGVAGVGFVPGMLQWMSLDGSSYSATPMVLAAGFLAAWAGVFTAFVAALAIAALCSRGLGNRSLRQRAVVVFLNSVWFLPLGPAIALMSVAPQQMQKRGISRSMENWWTGLLLLGLIVTLVALAKWMSHTIAGLRKARFANA